MERFQKLELVLAAERGQLARLVPAALQVETQLPWWADLWMVPRLLKESLQLG